MLCARVKICEKTGELVELDYIVSRSHSLSQSSPKFSLDYQIYIKRNWIESVKAQQYN